MSEMSSPTPSSPAAPTLLTLTSVARDKIRAVQQAENRAESALRVSVEEESAAAWRYHLYFVEPNERTPDDTSFDVEGIQIFVDDESAARLSGATLDYVEELSGSWFKFDNPNKPPLLGNPIAAKVQELLDDKINPQVASHGGRVMLADVQDTKVFLRFGGGCHGCGMSDVTLRQGIEVMIREAIPEVTEILDTTDHTSGANPYYRGP
ncbi:MAG: iron-sulfur cluster assembly accessory protein [Deltaproteobacteria bacterium]|nr:iron-sulfur cluster assembly accessory protein [Deltaproteobacteria bacterium]